MIAFYISLFIFSTVLTTSALFGKSNLNNKNNNVSNTSVQNIAQSVQGNHEITNITASPSAENSPVANLTSTAPPDTPTPTKKVWIGTPTAYIKPSTKLTLPTAIPISPTVKPAATLTLTPFPTIEKSANLLIGLNADKLFGMVNNYRKENGKADFIKDETTCAIADIRATQVYNEIYGTGTMHSGLKAMQLSYWITENIINYNTEEQAFNWWKNDTIHRNQMLGDFKYSCTSCSEYSCSQVFTDYIPK